MKTEFIGPIRDILAQGRVLLFGDPYANPTDFKGILASAEGIQQAGNEFRIPMKTRRNQSVGFRLENEYLPAPGASQYSYLTEPLRSGYALFNITGQLMKAANGGDGSFAPAFKQEMTDTTLASKLDFNRAGFGDGSGKMATIPGTGGGASPVVDTTVNFRGLGEVVDIVVPATGAFTNANCAARTVLAVNRATLTLTLDAAATNAAGDILVRASSDSTSTVPNNSFQKEINGLTNIVSATGVLHGFNPATYSWWASYVQPGVGPISDSVMRQAKDTVGFNAGIDVADDGLDYVLITTRGVRKRYSDTLLGIKRFNSTDTVKLNGGFSALMFDENPIFVDDQCPVGNMFGLATNKLFWSQMSDWDWMDQDGQVLKWDPRHDRYIAVLYKYCNLGTTFRTAHFRLSGITDDVR